MVGVISTDQDVKIKSDPDQNLSPGRRKSKDETSTFEDFLRKSEPVEADAVKRERPEEQSDEALPKILKYTPISMRSSGSSSSSLVRSPSRTPPPLGCLGPSGSGQPPTTATTCLPSSYSPASCHSSSASPGSSSSATNRAVNSPLGSPQTVSTTPTSGPLLFQPFLPFQTSGSESILAAAAGRAGITRPLPFSIDNILKPTFGGRDGFTSKSRRAGRSVFSLSSVFRPASPAFRCYISSIKIF